MNYLLTLRSLVKLRLMDVSPVCLNWRRSLLRMIKKSNEMQFSGTNSPHLKLAASHGSENGKKVLSLVSSEL